MDYKTHLYKRFRQKMKESSIDIDIREKRARKIDMIVKENISMNDLQIKLNNAIQKAQKKRIKILEI